MAVRSATATQTAQPGIAMGIGLRRGVQAQREVKAPQQTDNADVTLAMDQQKSRPLVGTHHPSGNQMSVSCPSANDQHARAQGAEGNVVYVRTWERTQRTS